MDLITTHLNADFDGLASMLAGRKLYPGALLAFPGGAQETVRRFLSIHDIGLTRLKDVDRSRITRLIVMDTNDPDRVGPLKELWADPSVSVHLYDHHPLLGSYGERQSPFKVERQVFEPVGATVTILIERLRAGQLSITPFEATVLAIGLYEETASLIFASTTPRDLDAAAHVLRAGADLNQVADALRRRLEPELITLLNDLLHTGETYYLEGRKILLATSSYDGYRGDLAEVVHRLAEIQGFDAVVAAFSMDDKVAIIARSREADIDIGELMREFGGGGHAVAAAATVKGRTLVEVRGQLADLLTRRFRPTLLARDVMTSPVKVVGDSATVSDAEAMLTRQGVNALPVVTRSRRYLGVITRETIQKGLFHGLGAMPVKDMMQSDAYTAAADTPFHDIEAEMLERNQRVVPIVLDGKTVGIITRTDLLRTLHDDVLVAARARAKGEAVEASRQTRNIAGLMKARLPERIVRLLKEAGALAERTRVSAFVVGGFVRDLLLDRPNLDVDLVIEGDGIAYARAFAKEFHASLTVHDRFGTAVLLFDDGVKLDVATARTEYYEYPTALPTVESSSIKKDLARRDFTINALAVRVNTGRFGQLIDFYGGQRDIHDRTIRVLHGLSFVEDPTRVFRAIRFAHRFGFRLGPETLSLIKGAVKMDLFHRLSGSRLFHELVLVLSEEEPRKALIRMRDFDLLRFIHPDLKKPSRLDAVLKPVEDVLDWYHLLYLDRRIEGWIVYLLAFMDMLPIEAVQETLTRLTVPERHAVKIRTGRFRSADLLRRLNRRQLLRPAEIYRTLTGLPDEVVLFLMAKTKSEAAKRAISAYVTTYQHVKPILSGVHLKHLGIRPGPIYKKVLNKLLDARLNGDISTEAEEWALAKHTVQGRKP